MRAVGGAAAVSAAVVVVKEKLPQLLMPLHQIVDDIELPSNSGILTRIERIYLTRTSLLVQKPLVDNTKIKGIPAQIVVTARALEVY